METITSATERLGPDPVELTLQVNGAERHLAIEPRVTLVILAYGYLLSAFVEMALARLRSHRWIRKYVVM